MRKTTEKEVEAVLKLDGPARFKHFIKRAADEQKVWGLRDGGWVMMGDAHGTSAFALWPASPYAQRCATPGSKEVPTEIPLDDLMEKLLPKLEADGVSIAVFPTPQGKGVIVGVVTLRAALEEELEWYG